MDKEVSMDKDPDFYLASVDTGPPINPRKCFVEEKLLYEGRGDIVLLIRIEPPIVSAPQWSPPAPTLSEAVVAARFMGGKLDPINEWPMDVYICRVMNDQIKGSGHISGKDISNEYWGELYRTFEEADKYVQVHRQYYGGRGI